MIQFYRGLFLLVVAFLAISVEYSAAEQDYSNHPVVVRMQELDEMLANKNTEGTKFNIAMFIRNELDRNTPSINREMTTIDRGLSMIALLKLLATVRGRFVLENSDYGYPFFAFDEFWNIYSATMKELLITSTENPAIEFQRNHEIAEYVLDWYSYVELLEMLANYYPRRGEVEWISYACMLAIENSSHLKNSFSKGMLLKLNMVRNKANAINIVQSIRTSNITEHVIRFPFKKIMMDMELSNRNELNGRILETQLKKILIEETFDYAVSTRTQYTSDLMQERSEAIIYSALLELTNDELSNHIEGITYTLQVYEATLNNIVIDRLHSMLRNRCISLLILNNGLSERLQDYSHIRMNMQDIYQQTIQLSPKYLDYLSIILRTINRNISRQIIDQILRIYYGAASIMTDQAVLNDQVILAELDKSLIALYESDELAFQFKPKWLRLSSHDYLANYANKAEELLMTISAGSNENSFNIRNQCRILLRFAVHMANVHKNAHIRSVSDLNEKVATTYIILMNLGEDVFIEDSVLMKEWYRFTLNYPKQVLKAIDAVNVQELTQYTTTGGSNADAVRYVFLARMANLLASRDYKSEAKDLFEKVLELEERVGYADTAATFIQKQVLREKQLFYIYYSEEVINLQIDLTNLVEHHIELLTSLEDWFDKKLPIDPKYSVRDLARRHLITAIHSAAVKNSNNGNNLLNDPNGRLRLMVNQLINGLIREQGVGDDFGADIPERMFREMTISE